jgi:signal transduction histidine kinase
MTGWQVAAACACAAPGIILGVLLAVRRQWTIGSLLIALGAMPLVLLSPDSSGQPAGTSTPQGIHFIVAVLGASSWIWFYLPPTLLAIYFPDGRLPSPRWRWFLVGWAVFAVVFSFAVAGDPDSYGDGPGQIPGHPPDQLSQSVSSVVGLVALALLLCLLVSSFVAVALRYRRGSAVVRRQIKWFAMSALLLPFVLVATWIAYAFTDYADVVVVVGLLAVFVSVPITVATAVLRHDLYDIDQLLSRTVSYALISGLLTALFATAVVGVGLLVGQGSDITVAVATVACALAFGPIRRRVQDLVDARFDRTHRDALALVADFVDAVRDGSSEPEQIEDTLRRAIRDPQLRMVYAVSSDPDTPWRDGAGKAASHPAEPFLDIAVRGRLLGTVALSAAAERPGLVRDVLREAHIPLELARSRIELRHALAETEASRARLLIAADIERHQLERDLHDGAQQQLIAIGMSLKLAQQRLPTDDPSQEVLGRAVRDLQAAVVDLRRLAGGVRPRGLDEGLPTAIRGMVLASPIPIDVQVTPQPLPDALATTAYYVAAEAVANALKHADPRSVRIDVSRAGDTVHVRVADDGCGGAQIVPGSGLAGLHDRVLACGGKLVILSEFGKGTTVEALLPCAS